MCCIRRVPYLIALVAVPAAALFLTGCGRAPNFWADATPEQKKILVSFPPLYAITHAVAGDDAYVLSVLTTRGPHGYDGTPTDALMVKHADLFIYNGLTLDDVFVENMLRGHKTTPTLNIGAVLEKEHENLLMHAQCNDPSHKHGEHDPHFWLGPKQAMVITRLVAARLAAIDPGKKKGYDERAEKFIEELKKVQEYGDAAFKDKKNKKLISQHESLGYFAKEFKLEIPASIQMQPGVEPDAASIATLVKLCRAPDGPRVIAVEPQYSAGQAEALKGTLKREGIELAVIILDPLETAEKARGQKFNPDPDYYLKKMRENIDTLAGALP